jgi:hypothetical protein
MDAPAASLAPSTASLAATSSPASFTAPSCGVVHALTDGRTRLERRLWRKEHRANCQCTLLASRERRLERRRLEHRRKILRIWAPSPALGCAEKVHILVVGLDINNNVPERFEAEHARRRQLCQTGR